MRPRNKLTALAAPICLALIAGCQQPAQDMQSMKPPPRPAELDRLNPWIGTWNGTGQMTMYTKEGPQQMNVSYSERIEWVAGNRFVQARSDMNMGEGETMQMTAIFGWDSDRKTFKVWEFMSNGDVSTMEMEYDEDDGHWEMEGRGKHFMTREPTQSEGTMKMVDNNTIEWQFTMWDGWKFKKLMEGKGTSKRQ